MSYLDQIAEEMKIPNAEIEKYMGEHDTDSSVVSIEGYADDLKKSLLEGNEVEKGVTLESEKTHDVFRARLGELTVESGKQGCGKSARHFLRAMAFAMQGVNSCIASLEMRPVESLKRGLFQFMGNDTPPTHQVDLFMNTFKDHIKIYSKVGTQSTDKILALVRWCSENNIQHIFIDSLMKCSIKSSDIDTVETFANTLQGLAKDLNVHVWLIAHQTKGGEGVSKEDAVRGSGMLLDLADNFIFYEKNIRKHEVMAKQEMGATITAIEEDVLKQPDFFMEFRKQRHSTIVMPRRYGFWGHKSMQFLPFSSATPMNCDDWLAGKIR